MFKHHCWCVCFAHCKDFIAENCCLANYYVLRQGGLPSILLYLPWSKCLIISVNLADCHPVENFSAPYYLFIHEIFIKSVLTLCWTLCGNYLCKDKYVKFLSISRLQAEEGTRWVSESEGWRVTVDAESSLWKRQWEGREERGQFYSVVCYQNWVSKDL